MTVTRAELEENIARLRAEVTDTRAGLYGPGSTSWEIAKESILFLGGGRAALLQLAHPFVAHAVDQHSQTKTDPLGRFQRTFSNVFDMVFGDLETAIRSARRVHAIHSRVHGELDEDIGGFARGTEYQANDEGALLWVHATLLDTAVRTYELVVRPLERHEKQRQYEESKRFARLFGISNRTLPVDWDAFQVYFERMLSSPSIAVGRTAREVASFLFKPPRAAYRPLFRWLELMTAGLLPEPLRREFGLPYGRAERAIFLSSIASLRRGYRHLPRRLRYLPAYVAARRRLAGRDGPDRVGLWLERLAVMPLRRPHVRARVAATRPERA